MKELRDYNPKLYQQLQDKPELILEIKTTILQNSDSAQAAADAEAITAAADNL